MSEEGSIRIAACSSARDSASTLAKLRPIGSQQSNHTCTEETELLEETLHSHLRLPLIIKDNMSIMMLNDFFSKSNLYGFTLGSGEGGLAQRLPDP